MITHRFHVKENTIGFKHAAGLAIESKQVAQLLVYYLAISTCVISSSNLLSSRIKHNGRY